MAAQKGAPQPLELVYDIPTREEVRAKTSAELPPPKKTCTHTDTCRLHSPYYTKYSFCNRSVMEYDVRRRPVSNETGSSTGRPKKQRWRCNFGTSGWVYLFLVSWTLPSSSHCHAFEFGNLLSKYKTENPAVAFASASEARTATSAQVQNCLAKLPQYDINHDGWLQKSEFVQLVRQGLKACYQDYSVVDATFYTFACQNCSSAYNTTGKNATCCVRNANVTFQYAPVELPFCVVLIGAIDAQCSHPSAAPTGAAFAIVQAPTTGTRAPVVAPSTVAPMALAPTASPATNASTIAPTTPTPQPSAPTPTNKSRSPTESPTSSPVSLPPPPPPPPTMEPTNMTTPAPNPTALPNSPTTSAIQSRATLHFNYTVMFTVHNGLVYTSDDRKQWLIHAFDSLSNDTLQVIVEEANTATKMSPAPTVPGNRKARRQLFLRTARTTRIDVEVSSSSRERTLQQHNATLLPRLDLPSTMIQFQPLAPKYCNDCWKVIQSITLLNTPESEIQQFRNTMIAHIQGGWFFYVLQNQFVPTVVTVVPPAMEPTPAPSSSPSPAAAGNATQLTMTSKGGNGLPVYAIVLIGLAGAIAAALLYFCCFQQTKTRTPAPSRRKNNHTTNNGMGAATNANQGEFTISVPPKSKSNLRSSLKKDDPPNSIHVTNWNTYPKSEMTASRASSPGDDPESATNPAETSVSGSDKMEQQRSSLKGKAIPPSKYDTPATYSALESRSAPKTDDDQAATGSDTSQKSNRKSSLQRSNLPQSENDTSEATHKDEDTDAVPTRQDKSRSMDVVAAASLLAASNTASSDPERSSVKSSQKSSWKGGNHPPSQTPQKTKEPAVDTTGQSRSSLKSSLNSSLKNSNFEPPESPSATTAPPVISHAKEQSVRTNDPRRSSLKSSLKGSGSQIPSNPTTAASNSLRRPSLNDDTRRPSAGDNQLTSPKKSRLSLGGLRNSIRNSLKSPQRAPGPASQRRNLFEEGKEEEKLEDEAPIRIGPMEAVAMAPTIRSVAAMRPYYALQGGSQDSEDGYSSPPSPQHSHPSSHSASASTKRKKRGSSFGEHGASAFLFRSLCLLHIS